MIKRSDDSKFTDFSLDLVRIPSHDLDFEYSVSESGFIYPNRALIRFASPILMVVGPRLETFTKTSPRIANEKLACAFRVSVATDASATDDERGVATAQGILVPVDRLPIASCPE